MPICKQMHCFQRKTNLPLCLAAGGTAMTQVLIASRLYTHSNMGASALAIPPSPLHSDDTMLSLLLAGQRRRKSENTLACQKYVLLLLVPKSEKVTQYRRRKLKSRLCNLKQR